ncbi:uncharacterized protein LY89DRAFT_324978 [Mollisia scopiformis]|uniref:Uncharacterized protein n=1 Tax=Mollisia scopiformis TaxID=149040 RepID=A0A132B8I9_MOLSC|nr:uncharacterized protein LY89DRAFT_324978 [Mollisia scopiformis]KUJ08716.1 hypothetical protein LY89DRAFT_324978 [Mollisia scopiformis]
MSQILWLAGLMSSRVDARNLVIRRKWGKLSAVTGSDLAAFPLGSNLFRNSVTFSSQNVKTSSIIRRLLRRIKIRGLYRLSSKKCSSECGCFLCVAEFKPMT